MSIELNGTKWTTWNDVRKEMFTEEEIAESNLRVALIGEQTKVRKEKGISPKDSLWQTFMDGLNSFTDDIFEDGRDQGIQEENEQ